MIRFFRSLFGGGQPPQPPVRRSSGVRTPNRPVVEAASEACGTGTYFEALRASDHRSSIPYLTLATAQWIRSINRVELAMLTRWLYDNVSLAGYAVGQIKLYSSRVTPIGDADEKDWNKAADLIFSRWAKVADVSGRFTYDDLSDLNLVHRVLEGDVGTRFVDVNGFPQVEIIEGCRIGNQNYVTDPSLRDGVLVDSTGRVLGYRVYTGKSISGALEYVDYDSNSMKLWYNPDAYSDYRGLTNFRRGSNDLRDAMDIKGFVKLRTKISAALSGYLEGEGEIEEDVWGDDTGPDGVTPGGVIPEGMTKQESSFTVADLLGGEIKKLPSGLKFNQTTVPAANDTSEFLATLSAHFVMSLDYPPAFFLDEKLTGPNTRAVNGKAQRKFDREIEVQMRWAEWCWIRVIGDAITRGLLPAVPGWDTPQFRTPAKISIDAGRDSGNERDDVESKLMTRREHYGNRQEDWMTETNQAFAEDDYILDRAKEQATRTGVPIEVILQRWGFDTQKKDPQNPKDQKK